MKPMFCLWDTEKDAPAYTIDRTLDLYRFKKDAARELRDLDAIGMASGLAVREITIATKEQP
jgi:hypothetical protein